jgi:hypothetical protein
VEPDRKYKALASELAGGFSANPPTKSTQFQMAQVLHAMLDDAEASGWIVVSDSVELAVVLFVADSVAYTLNFDNRAEAVSVRCLGPLNGGEYQERFQYEGQHYWVVIEFEHERLPDGRVEAKRRYEHSGAPDDEPWDAIRAAFRCWASAPSTPRG